ncbi:hypothetical protein, partial [Pseudomonas veronii]|uniref:hypothetical protein n=1 Tax=Pseudomonas veronii TaxID=76761 RepID=UPI001B807CE2
SSGATLIVALGHTPNRRRIDLSKPTTPPVDQYCKNGGDHRFLWVEYRVGRFKASEAFKINTAKHVQNNIFVQLSILEPQYPAPHDQGAGPWHAYWFHCFWY